MPAVPPCAEREQNRVAIRIGWLLLIYFLIRIPIANLMVWQGLAEDNTGVQTLEFSMYLTCAAMIVVARKALVDFRIDRQTLILFLVFGSVLQLPPLTDAGIDAIGYGFALEAIVLVVVIFASGRVPGKWATVSSKWLILGLLVGLAPALLLIAFIATFSATNLLTDPTLPARTAVFTAAFLHHMGHSAILEDLAFWGFLWGYLEWRGWNQPSIWQLQAAAIWLAHLRYIDKPVTFFVSIPLGGLLLGWLAWRSKSLAPSLLAHASHNAIRSFF